MELKKNPEVDVEKKKPFFFFTGLVFALALVLVAFEWKIFDQSNMDLGTLNIELDEEEMIPITQQQPPPPPPPPPPTTVLEIVEDDEEIEEELEIEDTEVDEDTQVEIIDIVEEEEVAEPEIFTIVEDMPSFPGGEQALFKYLGENTKYPSMAKDAGVQGVVYVTFVVMEDGSIESVKVLRGIGGGCDEEAVRVVKNMPSWSPGKQRGKPVRVQYNLPIRFILR
jgi:protein TonB